MKASAGFARSRWSELSRSSIKKSPRLNANSGSRATAEEIRSRSPDAKRGSVLHQVRHDEREREEEQAQNEIAEETVSLAPGDPGRPEGDRDPDDEPDDADA